MSRTQSVVGDLAALPDHNFGSTSMGWWGVIGFMLIEGAAFVLAIGAYFYLLPYERGEWPPANVPPPLSWGTAFAVLAVFSEIPNQWVKKRAQHYDLASVRAGLVLMFGIGVVLLVIRAFEFGALNVRWDQNAYGSIVWALLALHTLHTATDLFDTGVLMALVFVKHVDGRKFADVADNALYWHFIVWSWLVLYAVVYWTPRWL
ncbi:MAG: cytochrome c oxidase subunit 3 [Gammaproteobacteria bacterium]